MAFPALLLRSTYGLLAYSLVFFLLCAACHHGHHGVSDLQVGNGGNQDIFLGEALPVTAHIATDAPIARVDVAIRPVSGEGWTLSNEYTEGLDGKMHVQFETIIVVPDTVRTGDYMLKLRVIDTAECISEDSIRFNLTIDNTTPQASALDVGINAAGNDLHLETELSAPLGIAAVVVEIKGGTWSETFAFSGKELVGQLTHRFHEHIRVTEAPKGSYSVQLVVEDRKGRQTRTTGVFTK